MNGYGSADRAGSNTQPRTSPGSAQLSVLSTVGAQLNTAPAACYVFTYISKNAKIPTASSGISTPLLYYITLCGVIIGLRFKPYLHKIEKVIWGERPLLWRGFSLQYIQHSSSVRRHTAYLVLLGGELGEL